MWTAELINLERFETNVKATIRYTNGVETFELTHIGSEESLKQAVTTKLAKLAESDAFLAKKDSVLGEIEPVVATPPTAEETARNNFFIGVGRLNQYDNLIKIGAVANDNQDYLAIKSSVASSFLKSYIQ